jgi:hypothetical protein
MTDDLLARIEAIEARQSEYRQHDPNCAWLAEERYYAWHPPAPERRALCDCWIAGRPVPMPDVWRQAEPDDPEGVVLTGGIHFRRSPHVEAGVKIAGAFGVPPRVLGPEYQTAALWTLLVDLRTWEETSTGEKSDVVGYGYAADRVAEILHGEIEEDGSEPAVVVVAEAGTCDLCGQQMIRTADDCWHPWSVATACPPEPPSTDLAAYAEWVVAGNRTGRPGREHFIPDGGHRG